MPEPTLRISPQALHRSEHHREISRRVGSPRCSRCSCLAAGAGLFWRTARKKSRPSYVSTGTDRYSTDTAQSPPATSTSTSTTPGGGAGPDSYGKLRLNVSSRDDKPVFVGIARRSDVTGVPARHRARRPDRASSYSPFHADYRNAAGLPGATPPSEQRI